MNLRVLIDKKCVISIDRNTVLGVEKSPDPDSKVKYHELIDVFKFKIFLRNNVLPVAFFAKSEVERDIFYNKLDQFLSVGNNCDIEITLDSELNKDLI